MAGKVADQVGQVFLPIDFQQGKEIDDLLAKLGVAFDGDSVFEEMRFLVPAERQRQETQRRAADLDFSGQVFTGRDLDICFMDRKLKAESKSLKF